MAQVIFSSLPSNRSNLVTWYKVASGQMTLAGNRLEKTFCFDDTFTVREIGRPFPRVQLTYENPLILGETVSFFTNFQNPGEIPQNASVRVFKNSVGGEELTNRFTIQKVDLESGNFYCTLLPNSNLKDWTRLALVLTNETEVTHISRGFVMFPYMKNVFRLTTEPQNSVYFHYPYQDPSVLSSFRQSLFVQGSLIDVTYPEESEVYREVTTGRTREEIKMIGRRLNVETYFMDLLAHEAIAASFFHKGVQVNDLYVSKTGDYDPGMAKDRDTSSGSLELIDLGYGHRIKSC